MLQLTDIEYINKKCNEILSLNINAEGLSYRDLAILKYQNYVANKLLKISDNFDSAYTDFLKENWRLINGSLLSYTSIHSQEITQLCIFIAERIDQFKGKGSLQLLMPSLKVSLKEVNAVAEKYKLKFSLTDIVKNSIVTQNGESLSSVLDIFAIYKENFEFDDDLSKVKIYNQFNVEREDILSDHDYFLSPVEIKKLFNHSELCNEIWNNYLSIHQLSLKGDNLYSELSKLEMLLRRNSKQGVGTEENAGAGGIPAIFTFFHEYYKLLTKEQRLEIPVEVKNQIAFLGQMIVYQDEYDSFIPPQGGSNIWTCLDTRSTELQKAIKNCVEKLSSISVNKESKEFIDMISKLQKEKKTLENRLHTELEEKKYTGCDQLSVTLVILDKFNIKIPRQFENEQSFFSFINQSEYTDLALFLPKKYYDEDFFERVDFINFINSCSNEKIGLFLGTQLKPYQIKGIIQVYKNIISDNLNTEINNHTISYSEFYGMYEQGKLKNYDDSKIKVLFTVSIRDRYDVKEFFSRPIKECEELVITLIKKIINDDNYNTKYILENIKYNKLLMVVQNKDDLIWLLNLADNKIIESHLSDVKEMIEKYELTPRDIIKSFCKKYGVRSQDILEYFTYEELFQKITEKEDLTFLLREVVPASVNEYLGQISKYIGEYELDAKDLCDIFAGGSYNPIFLEIIRKKLPEEIEKLSSINTYNNNLLSVACRSGSVDVVVYLFNTLKSKINLDEVHKYYEDSEILSFLGLLLKEGSYDMLLALEKDFDYKKYITPTIIEDLFKIGETSSTYEAEKDTFGKLLKINQFKIPESVELINIRNLDALEYYISKKENNSIINEFNGGDARQKSFMWSAKSSTYITVAFPVLFKIVGLESFVSMLKFSGPLRWNMLKGTLLHNITFDLDFHKMILQLIGINEYVEILAIEGSGGNVLRAVATRYGEYKLIADFIIETLEDKSIEKLLSKDDVILIKKGENINSISKEKLSKIYNLD